MDQGGAAPTPVSGTRGKRSSRSRTGSLTSTVTGDGEIECIQPGQRDGDRARPDHARTRRNLGGARQRQCRPADGRRQRSRRGPARRPVYTLRRVWLTKGRRSNTTTAWPTRDCGRCATSPSRAGLSIRGLGELSRGQPGLRGRRARGSRGRAGDRVHSGLPFRPAAADAQGPQPESDRRPVLAHPLAQPRDLSAFPWKEELLDGLLGNDLLASICSIIARISWRPWTGHRSAKVDKEHCEITAAAGRHGSALSRSASISRSTRDAERRSESAHGTLAPRAELIRPASLGIGIDRADYTKGIPERLHALDRFLEDNPEYRGKLGLLQVAVPSRDAYPRISAAEHEMDRLAEAINSRWAHGGWRPIRFARGICPSRE